MARAVDGESTIIEQAADMANQHDLMRLIVTPIAPSLDWFELGKFLFPITQHMWFDRTELAHLTNSEVPLRGNGGKPAFRQVQR